MDSPVTKSWHTANFCNIAGALRRQAERRGGATAIHCPGSRHVGAKKSSSYTYLEFNELTNAYARGLEDLGLRHGDRAILMAEPGLQFTVLFLALARVGAVPVLTSPGMPPNVLGKCINEIEPRAFIGSPGSNLQRKMKGWGKPGCEITVSTGRSIPAVATGMKALYKLGMNDTREVFYNSRPDDIAAISFTAGLSGDPKPVVYHHSHFSAQTEVMQQVFDIEKAETSLSTNPLFTVFDPAFGTVSVIIGVDNNQPGPADARRLIQAVDDYRVSNIFLSPAMLVTLSHYVKQEKIKLPLVRRLITFGASPRLETIARLENALHDEARIHAPYGNTECFPVSDVTNHDVDRTLEEMMEDGEGVCVGKPVKGTEVRIIAPSDNPYKNMNNAPLLPPGMVGEIVVRGPQCTTDYWQQDDQAAHSRIPDESGQPWLRMGDIGSIDDSGRLWYCGRMSQRIDTGQECLYPDQAEALFNQHPDVRHTALVGVGPPGKQLPVLCAELRHKLRPADNERVHFDLLQLAQVCGLTRSVRTVLFHPGFPTDPLNSAAIPRAALSEWAAGKVKV